MGRHSGYHHTEETKEKCRKARARQDESKRVAGLKKWVAKAKAEGYFENRPPLNSEMLIRRGISISKAKMGHTFTDEDKGKISQTLIEGYASGRITSPRGMLGKTLSQEARQKVSRANIGKPKPPFAPEHIENIRKARAKQAPMSEETKAKISQISKALWQGSEFRNKVAKGMIKAVQSEPNKAEQFLINFFEAHNLPFKYVGDGEFILGGKCPDFLNTNGQKQLIELFGNYWHKPSEVNPRIRHFQQYGFDTLIIWEGELKDAGKLLEKVKAFTAEEE